MVSMVEKTCQFVNTLSAGKNECWLKLSNANSCWSLPVTLYHGKQFTINVFFC